MLICSFAKSAWFQVKILLTFTSTMSLFNNFNGVWLVCCIGHSCSQTIDLAKEDVNRDEVYCVSFPTALD